MADALYQEYLPRPLISALSDDCIQKGKDIRDYYYYHRNYVMPTGVNNVADSLAAIKKLVFEEKKITMAQLLDAMKKNFEGQEELRQMLLSAPKFGNDDDYVDSIAEKVHFRILDDTRKYTTYYGYPYDTDGTNASVGYFLGFDVAATPEGRKAREPLHDGTVSPVQGRDKKGPSAVLKSVGKIDPLLSSNHLFNQRFAPQFLEHENREIFADYLKTWSDLGIHHIQFNVIDPDELKDAQKAPGEARRPDRQGGGLLGLLRGPDQDPAGRHHRQDGAESLVNANNQTGAPGLRLSEESERREPKGYGAD